MSILPNAVPTHTNKGLHGQRLVTFTGVGKPGIGTITIPLEPFGASTGPTRILWNGQVDKEFFFREKFPAQTVC